MTRITGSQDHRITGGGWAKKNRGANNQQGGWGSGWGCTPYKLQKISLLFLVKSFAYMSLAPLRITHMPQCMRIVISAAVRHVDASRLRARSCHNGSASIRALYASYRARAAESGRCHVNNASSIRSRVPVSITKLLCLFFFFMVLKEKRRQKNSALIIHAERHVKFFISVP